MVTENGEGVTPQWSDRPDREPEGFAAGMWYWETGRGRQTVLLVHGWSCDHAFMAPLAAHFARRSARVISVDMRGHGRSPAGDRGFSVPELGQDLGALMAELDLRDVILIGHSMGGVWALAATAVQPDRIATLAMLDSAVAVPPGTAEQIGQFAAALRGDDWRQLREETIRSYVIPESNPRLVRWAVERTSRTSQEVTAGTVAGISEYVEAGADADLRRWAGPLLFIGTQAPLADYRRLRELVPTADIGQVVDSGHFIQLEVPEQVTAMLDRHLRLRTPR